MWHTTTLLLSPRVFSVEKYTGARDDECTAARAAGAEGPVRVDERRGGRLAQRLEGLCGRGRWGHSDAPLYIFFMENH